MGKDDLRSVLEAYCKRGFYLFPLGRESKSPCIKDNLEQASNDIEKLMRWAVSFPSCNWGLSLAKSGLVAVDVDAGGVIEWDVLCQEFDEPHTLKAGSGSGVGSHYVFKAEKGKRYRGKLATGIDVKHNGYIAVYPSVHPKTKRRYQWVNELPPADLTPWLVERIEKPQHTPKLMAEVYAAPEAARFKTVVEQIKEKEFDYATWVKLGMSLHAAFQGSEEGLDIFIDMSSGVSCKSGDEEAAARKWGSFSLKGDLTAASFFYAAREMGCTVPQEGISEDKKLFAALPLPPLPKEPKKKTSAEIEEPTPTWRENSRSLLSTDDPLFLINEVNAQGYAMLGAALSGQIIMQWTSENGVPHFRVIQAENFKRVLRDRALRVPTERGHKLIAASDIWEQSSRKRKYRNVVFKPFADFEDLNLWCDIPCKRREGDVSLILELIYVLCGENQAKADYLVTWLAHLVQKPEEKPIIVPVFIGEEGAGKGMLFDEIVRRILTNDFYIRLDKAGTIKEKFNAEQAKKFLTVLDEASGQNDRDLVNVMKSLTGSSTMTVEEKFGARYTIENYSRYVILSNENDAVKLGLTNRRYIVFATSSKWKGTDKFERIMSGLRDDSSHEAFYDYLMKTDIKSFNPFVFPSALDTDADETKVASMSPTGQFWSDVFFEQPQRLFQNVSGGLCLPKSGAFNAFMAHTEMTRPQGRRFSRRQFIVESEALMPVLKSRSTRYRVGEGEERLRSWNVTPEEMMQSYCKKSNIARPVGFDGGEYLEDTEF